MNRDRYRPTERRAPAEEVRVTDKQFLALSAKLAPSIHCARPLPHRTLVTIIETSRDILHKITEKDNPQALVGVFPIRPRGLDSIHRDASFVWIVCQSLKDPGNLGTILRTADAVGAGGVILLDQSCDPFSVEAVRASMGALFTQAVVQADGAAFFEWLRQGPGQLVGASLNTDHDYQAVAYTAPTFLFMGNEQSGLPPEYEAQCDLLVKIPMAGKADSLNVAVSCAVLLYEVFNQRRRARTTP